MEESVTVQQTIATQTLYDKLGGAKGITSIIDGMVEAHLQNPIIRARFLPYLEDPDKVQVIKQHACEFMGMGSGGPVVYTGRDMVTTHKGMNISTEEFVAAVDDIMMVLDRHQVDEPTKKEMLYMLYSLKSQIVRV